MQGRESWLDCTIRSCIQAGRWRLRIPDEQSLALWPPASLPRERGPEGGNRRLHPGATVYLGSCAACHRIDGKGQAPLMPPLAGNPAVFDANPSSLINLVLNGAEPLVVKGTPDAYRMPQYRIQLNDEEIAQVLSFVRSAWGNDATPVTTEQVKMLRPVTDPSSDRVIVLKMR